MRRIATACITLFILAACVGVLSLAGCAQSDGADRATAIGQEAEGALKESISIETSASRLVMSVKMVPEVGLASQDARKLGDDGLKTLDEADKLRVDARKQLENSQRLYASIDGLDAPAEFKKWIGMMVVLTDKWGEVLSHDEADSAVRRQALSMLVDGTYVKERVKFNALIEQTSSASGEKLMGELNRLAAEAQAFAQSQR